jgi:hypothetical protein
LVADHLELRLAAIHAVRAERRLRHEADERAAAAARLTTQMRNAAAVHADVDHPRTCQLGGASQSCDLPAELKVADPWGDSAWGCIVHVEEAVINVPGVFIADETLGNLAAYLRRRQGGLTGWGGPTSVVLDR